ncbi:hypothetical protein LTR37_014560 [Vermiconidia calcicola]|uniref:Uncharacterized protein n=1 Tax=Vermiconidia calcicola TaxID=1690605 RepID=A0ACC3MT60_9PEZI|nr:hypothetical protein LTR37_014560 [Vermiconidia calcicola]
MHSSFVALALMAASALAAPHTRRQVASDNEVRVTLQSQSTETGSQTSFDDVSMRKSMAPVGSSGPFETIKIAVGANVAKQDLRCQALDTAGAPLIAVRGNNTDITFSDDEKSCLTASEVSRIICDPSFEQIGADAFQVRVVLATSDLGTQTVFNDATKRSSSRQVGSSGPFEIVEIVVGALVDPELRCQLRDQNNEAIIATHGENRDTTFSDADKGEWTFEQESRVSRIVCDPAFVANNLNV